VLAAGIVFVHPTSNVSLLFFALAIVGNELAQMDASAVVG
jgi:hypothetical protein